MDQQVIDDLFNRAVSKGYKKSKNEFINLIHSDGQVFNDMYSYVKSKGYGKSPEDFSVLIGKTSQAEPVKKKEEVTQSEQPQQQAQPNLAASSQQADMASMLPNTSLGYTEQNKLQPQPSQPQPAKRTEFVTKATPEEQYKAPGVAETAQQFKEIGVKKEQPKNDFFNESIQIVNKDLMGKSIDEVTNMLKYHFGDYGFDVNQNPDNANIVDIKAKNGKTMQFRTDELFNFKDQQIADNVKDFLRENRLESERLKNIETKSINKEKKILGEDDIKQQLSSIDEDTKSFNEDVKLFIQAKSLYDNEKDKYLDITAEQLNSNPQLKSDYDAFIANRKRLSEIGSNIAQREQDLKDKSTQLQAAVGKYTEYKANVGTWEGALWNRIVGGAGSIIGGGLGIIGDIYNTNKPLDVNSKQYQDDFIKAAKEKGIEMPAGQDFDTFYKNNFENIKDIESKMRDNAKKEFKYGAEGKAGNVEKVKKILLDYLGTEGTTPEYINKLEENPIAKGVLAVAEFAPAMVASAYSGNAGFITAALTAQDNIMQQMNTPAFKDVSEDEKNKFAAPYAIVNGLLMGGGFTKAAAQEGVVNGFVARALSKLTKGSGAKTFADFVARDIESFAAKRILTIAGGFTSGFETGVELAAFDLAMKDVYNDFKDKEMFKTPKDWEEYAKVLAESGFTMGIGGGILSIPKAMSVYHLSPVQERFRGPQLDDGTFKIFEETTKDPEYQRMFKIDYQNKINQGLIPFEQAKKEFDNYVQLKGLLQAVDPSLNAEQKRDALAILQERQQLEKEIAGKDPNQGTIKVKQERIAKLNDMLSNIASLKYKLNGESLTKEEFIDKVNSMGKEELSNVKFEIPNDPATEKIVEQKIKENAVQEPSTEKQVLPSEQPELGLREVGKGDQGITTGQGEPKAVETETVSPAVPEGEPAPKEGEVVQAEPEVKAEPVAKEGEVKTTEQLKNIPFEQRTDKEHSDYIKQRLHEEFGAKGVKPEEIDASIALMDANAEVTGLGDAWYRQIEDVGKGEFQKTSKEVLNQQEAWHGSPHEFDKFTTEKIGTGEGAQAFGWGLYFTDLESIARSYADILSKNVKKQKTIFIDGQNLSELTEFKLRNIIDTDKIRTKDGLLLELNKIKENIQKEYETLPNDLKEKIIPHLEAISNDIKLVEKSKEIEVKNPSRNLYKVTLHEGKTPDQYTWLEWDNTIRSKKIIDLLKDKLPNAGSLYNKYVEGYGAEGKHLYNLISRTLGGDKQASLFLLENGIDGIKYPAESISRGSTSDNARGFNYVVFDENAVTISDKIKFQGAKGALETLENGRKIIHALESPDFSTLVHEVGHIFEDQLSPEEKETVQDWAKTKGWTKETSEKFARGFEKYLREGKSPIEKLNEIFAKAKKWLTTIYKKLKGSPIEKKLTPEIRKIFDDLLAKSKKRGPSAEKLLGEKPTEVIIKDEAAALRNQIRLEAKAAKEGAASVQQAKKKIIDYVNSVKEFGNLRRADYEKIINVIKSVVDDSSLDKGVDKINKIIDNAQTDVIEITKAKLEREKSAAAKVEKEIAKEKINKLRERIKKAKSEIKEIRKGVKDRKERRSQLSSFVSEMISGLELPKEKAESIIKKISKVNLDDLAMINRVLEYVDKVSQDAEYDNKIEKVNKLKAAIKKAAKGENKDFHLVEAAKSFLAIDPLHVENLDELIQKASELKEAIQGSKGDKKASAVNIAELEKYSEEQRIIKEEVILNDLREQVEEITGIDTSDLSYEELLDLSEKQVKKIKDETGSKLRAKNIFDSLIGIANQIMDTGVDPITGESIDIPKNSKRVMREYIDMMDINRMDLNDINKSIDAINNFIVNGSIARLEAVARTEKGKANAEKNAAMLKKQESQGKFKFKELSGYDKIITENISTLPMTFDKFFGTERALKIQEDMGLEDVREGYNKAVSETKKIAGDYAKQFENKKPNGQKFMSEENVVERGILKDLLRFDPERQDEDLKRKIDDLDHTIKQLEKGTADNKKEAEIVQKVKDKLFKGIDNPKDATIDDILKNAAQDNIDAANYQIEVFLKYRDLFTDVSEGIYNKKLSKDQNYTPRKIKIIKEDLKELGNDESMIERGSDTVYQKEAGILMKPTNKPLGKDQYVDYFNSDRNFIDKLEDGLVDAYTAAPIKQMNGYIGSDAFESIFPERDMRKLILDKLDNAIRLYRNKTYIERSELNNMVKKMNRIAGWGTKLGLISGTQYLKQLTPFANTMVNVGTAKALKQLDVLYDTDKLNFINNSNMDIAMRGAETLIHVEKANDMLKKAAESKGDVVLDKIDEVSEAYMRAFLTNPDAWAAKSAWLAYYEEALKKKNVDVSEINYADHEMDKDAARYAQKMLDSQQNVSVKALQGKIYTSKDPFVNFIRHTLFPLANFRMNQYDRIRKDWKTVFDKTASESEKAKAIKSLGAVKAEMLIYKLISTTASIFFGSLANWIRGKQETEEEFKKRVKQVLYGQAGTAVIEYLSPLPLLDFFVQTAIYLGLDKKDDILEVPKKERLNIFKPGAQHGEGLMGATKEMLNSFGALGMTTSKALDVVNAASMAVSDNIEDRYGNKKVLNDNDRNMIKAVTPIITLSNLLLLPNDFSNVGNKIVNGIVRDAKTESEIQRDLKHYLERGAYQDVYNVDPYKTTPYK